MKKRRLTLELPEELAAALTILAGRQGKTPEETAATLLLDAVFAFDESLLPTEAPPYVRLANSLLVSAIEQGADEARLVATTEGVEAWLEIDGHRQLLMPLPLYVLGPLQERFEKMTGATLRRIAAADEAPIPILHGERHYTVTAGYIADDASANRESLRLRIQPGRISKDSE
jgi:hypothetical protein